MVRLKPYPLHDELVRLVRELHAWGEHTGGWEARVWRDLCQVVKRIDNPGREFECLGCGSPDLEVNLGVAINTGIITYGRILEDGYLCLACGYEGDARYVGGRMPLKAR